MLIFKILFWFSLFLILYTFVGYPLTLYIIGKLYKNKKNKIDISLRPLVSIIIPAHNEEKVIEQKLNNLINLNYPNDHLQIIIASDNSTDRTNEIVENFIKNNLGYDISLYIVNKRQGKTNAQNEAVKIARGEILVFSDANAILDKDSIIHLVSSFTSEEIIYVTGRLSYVNNSEYMSSGAENNYWNYDLFMRKAESNIKTITAGNGAIYAIRKNEYVYFEPIKCHDSVMPLYAAVNNKRAVYNSNAIAYEKAGETSGDEFKRKIRMFRDILTSLFGTPKKYNILKYGWFSFFYFSHRTLRYSLFLLHIIIFITNAYIIKENTIYFYTFLFQLIFYLVSLLYKVSKIDNRLLYYPYYYSLTIVAQFIGAIYQSIGKSKPYWDKAESTR